MDCKPYLLDLPIQAEKQYLNLDPSLPEPELVTKKGIIEDALYITDF
jgi:hypothetical protein